MSDYIQTEKSGFGRGGMLTKSTRKVADEGIAVIIANGKKETSVRICCVIRTTVCTPFPSSYGGSVEYEEVDCAQEGFAKGNFI